MRATITAAAELTAASTDRVRRGLALPYGPAGRTSAGPVRAAAGVIRWPAEARRVKVFSDHGRQVPIGYCTAIAETDDGLTVAFQVAGTPAGDLALAEVDGGVRDAISVELDDVTLADDGLITAASLTAIALVPLPAFADARIAASLSTDRSSTMPTDPGTTVVVNQPAAPPAPPVSDPAPAPTSAPPVPAPTPADPPASLNAARQVTDRALNLAAAAAHLETAFRRDPRAESINAALTDIVPADDAAGGGILTPQWLGELWTPYAYRRDYINSVQSGTLTGMHLFGYKWETRPVVGDYAGNKTPIPSSPVSLVPATADAYRLAGGWDVDRIFYDLGAPGFLETILNLATEDLRGKQEAKFGTALKAAATPIVAPVPTTLFEALSAIAAKLGGIGARPTSIAVASDLYAALLAIPRDSAPWWLTQGSVDLGEQTANVGSGFSAFVDPALPAGTVLGWDRRAATFYEAKPTPIRVQAVNIPNGGIDVAVFSYQGEIINDDRTIVSTVVVPVVTPPAAQSASSSSRAK